MATSCIEIVESGLEQQFKSFRGNTATCLEELVKKHAIQHVCFDRTYIPEHDEQDKDIQIKLDALGCQVSYTSERTLWPLDEVRKQDGDPYKVFTPFFKKAV